MVAVAEARAAPGVVRYDSLAALAVPFYLPAALAHLCRALNMTVLPLHVLGLGFSYEQLGALTMVGGVGVVVGNVPAGKLTTAFGPRCSILASYAIFAVAAGLAALPPHSRGTPGLLLFGAAFFLFGAAESTGVLGRQTILGAAIPGSIRGRACSLLAGLQRGAFSLGPLVAGYLAEAVSPQAVYGMQALLAMLAAVATIAFMPFIHALQDVNASAAGKAHTGGQDQESVSMIMVVRRHWRLLARVAVFASFPFFIRKSRELLFSLEGHARRLSQEKVGDLAAVSFSVDFTLSFTAGALMDTFGRTRTGALSFTVGAVGPLLLISHRTGMATMMAFAIVSGMANGLSAGLVLTLGADTAPKDCRSNYLAVFRVISRFGDVGAPLALGWLAERGSLVAAELVVVAVCLAGLLWALSCVPETLPGRAPSEPVGGDGGAPAPVSLGLTAEAQEPEKAPELSPVRTKRVNQIGGGGGPAVFASDESQEEEPMMANVTSA